MKALPFDLVLKGLPIPFVAAWEHEQPDIQHDLLAGMGAVYTGRLDHRAEAKAGALGKVLLGQMAPQRQRYVMAHGLCQVCGRQMVHKIMLGHMQHHGPDKLLACDEPPCCPVCALLAIEFCPYAGREWAARGGLVVVDAQLFTQTVMIKKGDSRAMTGDGKQLPRATFRRWMGKPLANHLRMVPTKYGHIEGVEGVQALQVLADHEKAAR